MVWPYFETIRAAMKARSGGKSQPPASSETEQPKPERPQSTPNASQSRVVLKAKQPEAASEHSNRLYCMVPFIWTPKYAVSYHAIHKTWGKRCDVLKFMIDPIVGDKETGFLDLRTNGTNYKLPDDVVVIYDMERPWNSDTCLDSEVGNCRNIWEKI